MTGDGGEKREPERAGEPLGEPIDHDDLAPPPDEKSSASPSKDDAARAQAVARKLAGATGRRGALGRNPSASGETATQTTPSRGASVSSESKNPALAARTTTGGGTKATSGTATSTSATASAPIHGRRPLVDPSQRKQKAGRTPFYARLKIPAKPLLVVVALAVLGVGGWFGWKAIDRSRHADEYAVRDELFLFKFDQKDEHFANIDAMGTKAVVIAIGFLTDPRPVETSFGKSSTTTAELAHMYLMHYAQRVAVDPPPKALDVVRLGGVRMQAADWSELKDLWTKWFADVQAKGKAR